MKSLATTRCHRHWTCYRRRTWRRCHKHRRRAWERYYWQKEQEWITTQGDTWKGDIPSTLDLTAVPKASPAYIPKEIIYHQSCIGTLTHAPLGLPTPLCISLPMSGFTTTPYSIPYRHSHTPNPIASHTPSNNHKNWWTTLEPPRNLPGTT